MKKLSNTDAGLSKSIDYKQSVYFHESPNIYIWQDPDYTSSVKNFQEDLFI